ncbi:MAG: hypothetical protein HY245_12955 [Rhizobiales bacterium]|nr:hypothetical protein [Hyphomicrobiales bacterium]MBI3674299.1 hypothetical protein [Hyphomicrobiales bacterium]
MNNLLLFLHIFGLMLGATGGFGSAILMRKAATLPTDQAKVLKGQGPLFANVSAIGVALLVATGPIMVSSKYGGFAALPQLFWVKAIFIVTLVLAIGAIHLTYAEMRKGNMAVAARLPKIGPVAGVSALLATLFAVYTFGGG